MKGYPFPLAVRAWYPGKLVPLGSRAIRVSSPRRQYPLAHRPACSVSLGISTRGSQAVQVRNSLRVPRWSPARSNTSRLDERTRSSIRVFLTDPGLLPRPGHLWGLPSLPVGPRPPGSPPPCRSSPLMPLSDPSPHLRPRGGYGTGIESDLGAETLGGGKRIVYSPFAWLPPGHDPGAVVGVASNAQQRGLWP